MYAVIATDGKQYRVAKGQVLELESVKAQVGQLIHFDKILLCKCDEQVSIGRPYLETVKVIGKVIDHARGHKIRILKFKRRKHHMKRLGYRAHFARIEILDIQKQILKNKQNDPQVQSKTTQKELNQEKKQAHSPKQQQNKQANSLKTLPYSTKNT